MELFERGIRVFTADADITAIRAHLQAILSDAVTIIQDQRTQRLRARHIDPGKLDALAKLLTDALTPNLGCLTGFNIHKKPLHGNSTATWRINGIDKGQLVEPMMSDQSLTDLTQVIADAFRQHLAKSIWHAFFQAEHEVIEIDRSTYPDSYWEIILARAQQAGPHTALLVPYNPIGDGIARWQYAQAERPAGLEVQHLEGRPSGAGIGYVATVNGLDVFTAQVKQNHSYLFSTHKLKSVIYRWVEPNKFISVEFQEGDDPQTGTIALRFSQEARWRPTRITQFILTGPS